MNTLRLEELESRDLLSSSYVLPEPRFSPSFVDHRPTGFIERPPAPAIGGAQAMDMGAMESGPYLGMPPQVFPQVQESVVIELVIVIELPSSDAHVTNTGSDSGTAVNVSGSAPHPAITDAGLGALADASVAHASIPAKAASQSTLAPPPATNVSALATEAQGPVAAQLSARYTRVADTVIVPNSPMLAQIAASTGGATQTVTNEADPIETKPAEQLSALPALLSALPTVDLTSLGRGLNQFMHRLERDGEQLVGDGDGLRPWLVAAAAAATACEIARRQIQRTNDRDQATGGAFGPMTDV